MLDTSNMIRQNGKKFFRLWRNESDSFWYMLYPLDFQAEWILSLPASACPSARPSVCKLDLVRMITYHRFEVESPILHQTCIMEYSQLVLKMEIIDLHL